MKVGHVPTTVQGGSKTASKAAVFSCRCPGYLHFPVLHWLAMRIKAARFCRCGNRAKAKLLSRDILALVHINFEIGEKFSIDGCPLLLAICVTQRLPSESQIASRYFPSLRSRQLEAATSTTVNLRGFLALPPLFNSPLLFIHSAAGPAFQPCILLVLRHLPQSSIQSSQRRAYAKRKMPPKKEVKQEKILLGRPGNNLKSGIVCRAP
jgi:hypothetical protein